MNKNVITILQGSVVTQSVLGGLTIHPSVINFLQCVRAKNYKTLSRVVEFIGMKIWCSFFSPLGNFTGIIYFVIIVALPYTVNVCNFVQF